MLKHAFETSSRITKPASGSGAWLRVGSEDSPFIGVKLGIYAFSTRGDAENAREELFERYATELIVRRQID